MKGIYLRILIIKFYLSILSVFYKDIIYKDILKRYFIFFSFFFFVQVKMILKNKCFKRKKILKLTFILCNSILIFTYFSCMTLYFLFLFMHSLLANKIGFKYFPALAFLIKITDEGK